MSLFKQFQTDPKLERSGINVEYHDDDAEPGALPATFTVARAGGANVAYDKAIDREMKPLRRAIEAKTVSTETIKRAIRKAFIETCLLGWKNVMGQDGKPLDFSKENAEMLFTTLPELYEDLARQSNTVSLFLLTAKADEKN